VTYKKVFTISIEVKENDFCFSDLKECIFDGCINVGNHTITEVEREVEE